MSATGISTSASSGRVTGQSPQLATGRHDPDNARDRTATTREGDDSSPDPLDAVADGAPSAFDRLSDARRFDQISRALSALPDGQRRALTMFHMEGLQYQEIAARLGVPLGTVATWVMRARKSVAASVGVPEES